MRVILLIDNFEVGGAQRVMSALANRWATAGWDVTLVTLADPTDDAFPVEGVRRVGLGLFGPAVSTGDALRLNIKRLRSIRRLIKDVKPDVVISFMERLNVLTLIATSGLAVPVVVSERVDPRHHPVHPLVRIIRPMAYRRAATVVVQTESVARWAAARAGEGRVRVVPNPISPDFRARGSEPPERVETVIVGVGRLTPQKGFDLLIRAFATIAPSNAGARLVIYGEGPERSRLQQLAQDLGVAARIELAGVSLHMADVLRQADLFVLSSRYEGFPNVLLEALTVGVPSIAFACPSGPDEMIVDQVNGLLVPPQDVAALAHAMTKLITDHALRRRLSAQAPSTVERFSLDAVGTKWDAVVVDATT
jgi:GalNAc-alpha-(1->4)-GalNAc-alpha-(1->3)-diNAcBac-PP-undecaprenol alpha-1,4-N-acetyl-D-galactosaminyltransferase